MSFNILVVDDSVTIRAIIAKTLKMAEVPIANLFQASNGKEGLEIAKKEWIDVVFADDPPAIEEYILSLRISGLPVDLREVYPHDVVSRVDIEAIPELLPDPH